MRPRTSGGRAPDRARRARPGAALRLDGAARVSGRAGCLSRRRCQRRTGYRHTVYRLFLPSHGGSEQLAQALEILAGWANGVRFPAEAVERQRSIVLAESRSTHEDAGADGAPVLRELLEGSRFAERPPRGVAAAVESAAVSRLESFYRRWYRPEQMVVIVAGQFEPSVLVPALEQRFGGLPRSAGPGERVAVAGPTGGAQVTLVRDGTGPSQLQAIFQRHAPPARDERAWQEQLLDRVLCGLLDRRLVQAQRAKDSALDFVTCQSEHMNEVEFELIALTGGALPGHLRAAADALLAELERALQHGCTATEMEAARADVLEAIERAARARATGTVKASAVRMAEHFLYEAPLLSPEQENALAPRLLSGVDGSVVHARLRDWREPARRIFVGTRAPDDASLSSSEALAELTRAVGKRILAAPVDQAQPVPLLSTPPEPGAVIASESLDDVNSRLWRLNNGARVVFKPGRRGTHQVLVRASSPGGTSRSPEGEFWNAVLAPTLVSDSGVGEHDGQMISGLFESSGLRAQPWIAERVEGIDASGPSDELERLFQLMYLVASQPRRDAGVFERSVARLTRQPTPERQFHDAVARALYADPRRQGFSPELNDHFNLDAALRAYRDRFGDVGDFTFVIVGDTSAAQLKPLVERYIGSLSGSARDDSARDLGIRRRPGVTFVRRGGRAGTQSAVVLQFHSDVARSAEADVILEMLARALRRRLRERLRENLKQVYDGRHLQGGRPAQHHGAAARRSCRERRRGAAR